MTTTITVRRDEDDEVLGYLRPVGEKWQPMTVFHAALAEPTSRAAAEEVLRRDGLSSLSEAWWVEREPGDWQEARIQEARPDRLRVRWTDPYVDQPPTGHWIDPTVVRVRRSRPS